MFLPSINKNSFNNILVTTPLGSGIFATGSKKMKQKTEKISLQVQFRL